MSPLEDIRLRILKDTGESDDLTTNDQKMHCRLSGNGRTFLMVFVVIN